MAHDTLPTEPDAQNMILVDAFRRIRKPYDLARMRAGPQPAVDRNDEGVTSEDRLIPGPAGDIPVRLYRPRAAHDGALVYFHGGGFAFGDLDACDPICRELTRGAQCLTVSVDYRLAPENPFPAGLEDAYAALQWVMAQSSALGVTAGKVAVGGDSAGGNLATVTAMMARDAAAPMPLFQLLIYPGINLALNTPERRALSDRDYALSTDLIDFLNSLYCRDEAQLTDPRCAPAYAKDLSRLPPALVIGAQFDPLRFEGEDYMRRLTAAGVRASYSQYAGAVHGFVSCAGFIDSAHAALAECALALREALST